MKNYVTISGQTWDQIAYEVYGNEYLCDQLMDANRAKLHYFVFPDGVYLQLPEVNSLKTSAVSSDYPLWRALLNG